MFSAFWGTRYCWCCGCRWRHRLISANFSALDAQYLEDESDNKALQLLLFLIVDHQIVLVVDPFLNWSQETVDRFVMSAYGKIICWCVCRGKFSLVVSDGRSKESNESRFLARRNNIMNWPVWTFIKGRFLVTRFKVYLSIKVYVT